MNLRDLFHRLRALVAPRRVERELDEELAFHVERDTQRHIANGLSPADARNRALARFGPVLLAADQCRDARGMALVDDLARDIFFAFRTFRRAPLAALTIVGTVALGLGLVTAAFEVYSIFVLRTDAVRSPAELFAVEIEQRIGSDVKPNVELTRTGYDAMRRETSVFTDAFAILNGFDPRGSPLRWEGRLALSAYVTGNFFQVLGVQAALGRILLPADDQPFAGRPVIVLSHAGWRKFFQGDQAVIGRRVEIDGAPHEIVGVMPDGFRGLGLTPPDYWAPLALAGQVRSATAGREDQIVTEVIGRLKPGISPAAATAALTAWASSRTEASGGGGTIHVRLTPRQGTLSFQVIDTLIVFSPLFFAFGLILAIGCANVANLLLARGVSRQREIGIRLSLGASRRRIIRQLLTESLLLALAAAAGGLILSRLLLEGALYAAMTTIPPEIGQLVQVLNLAVPSPDWRIAAFLVVGAFASTAVFGLAPALHATRLELVPTMRGEVTRTAGPRGTRHGLIAVQVSASALLLISAAVFLRGAVAAATNDQGVRTSDTMTVNIDDETQRVELLQTLAADPLVAVVAAASGSTGGLLERSWGSLPVNRREVSSEYFNVLGLELVSGRHFTPAERAAESGVAIVSETVARDLWPAANGVGQVIRLGVPEAEPSRTLTVVGVVRNSGSESGPFDRDGLRRVYVPTDPESPGTTLYLRVRGNVDQARLALLERLTGLDPAFGVMTLRTMNGMQAYMLQIGFWVTVLLGGLALVLTASGLFSVLSYIVEQQAKEIGVRIALGAVTTDVVRLVLTQSLRPVSIGLVTGGGLAAAVATVLLVTPDAAEMHGWIQVFDPVAYAASLLVIVTSCALALSFPALRAARIDPIAMLRND